MERHSRQPLAVSALLLFACGAFGPAATGSQPSGGSRDLKIVPVLTEEGPPNRWAVVIGIDRYPKAPGHDLRYPVNDARSVETALEKYCGFSPDHVHLLCNEDATAARIKFELGVWLPHVARRDDLVVIYFSGHGTPDAALTDQGVRTYLVSSDVEIENIPGTAVPMDEISAFLMKLQSERVVVLLDCCFSGAASPAGAASPNRTFSRQDTAVPGVSGGFVDRLGGSGRGRAVLTACAPDEHAEEYRDLQHGIFTYYLLEGLEGRAADPDTGDVTAPRLYHYIYNKLRDDPHTRNKEPQTPMNAFSGAGEIVLAEKGAHSMPTAAAGQLKLLTSPLDAQVFIDREAAVKSPVDEKSLSAGVHHVAIYKPGYIPISDDVYITPGRTDVESYIMKVEETQGDLLVIAPAGASVKLDGTDIGEVGDGQELFRFGLGARSYQVQVEKAGYAPQERTVVVPPGRVTPQRFELEKAMAGRRSPTPADIPAGLKRDGDRYTWGKDGAVMAFVSEGPFWMGRDEEDNARPRHEENLPAFWIDAEEVTNGQYAHFAAETGYQAAGGWSRSGPEDDKKPAVRLTLDDARAYAKWAGKAIPTEAQWEKAARGTDGRRFPYGDVFNVRYQNIRLYGLRQLMDVGSIPQGASPYGVLDMLGNAWEWTESPYAPYPGAQADQSAYNKGFFVVRGGSFRSPTLATDLSVATRSFQRPNLGAEDVGFRCVLPVR